MTNSKTVKKGKWKRGNPEVMKKGRQMERIERTERKREIERQRQREKQMAAEKRQIETHWEDNIGSASEAQQGVWKAEKHQRKGKRKMGERC